MEPPGRRLRPITTPVAADRATEPFDGMAQIREDILHNILSKLPAKSFASAACVSRNWNAVCRHILSRPKLASALSLNPSLLGALDEVVEKVLSEPIRPHFAILAMDSGYRMEDAHRLINERFNSSIPLITCESSGIMGRDARTDEYKEVESENFGALFRPGILLTVGYLPGLKVHLAPLLRQQVLTDKFVMDIRDFTCSVSGSMSPEAIIMFGDGSCDLTSVLAKMDCAISMESIFVGNEGSRFKYTSCGNQCILSDPRDCVAVALVFARDKTELNGRGKIQFHLSLGAGTAPVGPPHKAVSVKVRSRECSTWITAKREGHDQIFDGLQMLDGLFNEGVDVIKFDLYVAVTKRRKCTFGSEKAKWKNSLSYHHILDGDEQYLYLHGLDIKTGDSFFFHVPNPEVALSSCNDVSENFKMLKRHLKIETCQYGRKPSSNGGKEVIGAIIFACRGRGESFFGKQHVDSSPILDNFPGIPLAGMFCSGEICRGPLVSINSPGQETSFTKGCLHVYSAVYLVLVYDP